jgi:predicted site-specific integrase-resolvase
MNASGSILVEIPPATKTEHNIIYARVSSPINKSNLDMQAERLTAFCSARGWVIHEIIKETASGLNDKRPKLKKILQEKKATRIIIEHKDRLTRFGFEYLKDLFPGEIITVNEVTEDEEDLMQDFVSLVTWYF